MSMRQNKLMAISKVPAVSLISADEEAGWAFDVLLFGIASCLHYAFAVEGTHLSRLLA